MKKLVRLIKGNDSVSVAIGVNIYTGIVEREKFTADIYALHKNNLILFSYIEGKKVRVKLYDSCEVVNELKSMADEDNFQIYNV
jgi:hypothetical protein